MRQLIFDQRIVKVVQAVGLGGRAVGCDFDRLYTRITDAGDRRGPLAAVLLLAAYGAALLWSQLWLAEALGAPIKARLDPALVKLLTINGWLLVWRVLMRAWFTSSAYGWKQGLLSVPRLIVGNIIAVLAAARAVSLHMGGGARRWDKTRHIFPAELPQ